MWQDLEVSQFEFTKNLITCFKTQSPAFAEAGATKSKNQGAAMTGPHHSLRLLYFVQCSVAEGEPPPPIPAAHTLMCMLRSIKLA